MVEPSAKIVPGFGIEIIVLKDGTTLAASVTKESPKSLDLKLPDGKSQKVSIAAIASRAPPPLKMTQSAHSGPSSLALTDSSRSKGAFYLGF